MFGHLHFTKITAILLVASLGLFANNHSKDRDIIEPTKAPQATIDTQKNRVSKAQDDLELAAQFQKVVTVQPTLEGTIASLAIQLMENKKIASDKSLLITSFVRLDNLKKTTEFGRIVSESLINELYTRDFNVVEFRGQLSVSVNNEGEYFITRDINKIKKNVQNSYVVVGTYSRQYKRTMLNARVIDNSTGNVISSARATYAHGLKDDCSIFKDCKPPRKISIVKE